MQGTKWFKGEMIQKVFMPVWDKGLSKVSEKLISILFYNAATTTATGLMAVSAVAGVSVVAAETIREDAPVEVVASAIKKSVQTFDPNLTGQRILSLDISNTDVGALGVLNGFEWDSTGSAVHRIESLTIVGIEAPSFTISGSIGSIVLLNGEVDGADYGNTVDILKSEYVFGSERGAGEGFTLDTVSIDRIAPVVDGGADSEIKSVTITDLASSSDISWDNLDIGTLIITDFKIGDGTGIASPSFSLTGTVRTPISITNVIEKPITVGG